MLMSKPFYEMTHQEVIEFLRSLYRAQPRADWDKLAVGNMILHKYQAWHITRIPPKRGFVLTAKVHSGKVEKLLRSQYDNDALKLTDERTFSILQMTHRDEIEKAMAAGIGINLAVQYDYPDLFTPYPESWSEERRKKAHSIWRRINEMRAFHDHSDGPGWQFGKIDKLIANAQEEIAHQETYLAECQAGVGIKKPEAIPRLVASISESIKDSEEEIEILGHLRKHVERVLPTV